MFSRRYFGGRYFGGGYFGGEGSVLAPADGGYFGTRYFGGRYFGGRYFGGTSGSGGVVLPVDGGYFGRRYFGGRYFGPRYFGKVLDSYDGDIWHYVNHQDPMSPMILDGVYVPPGGLETRQRNARLDRFGSSARMDIYLNGELQDVVTASPYPPRTTTIRAFTVGDGVSSEFILTHMFGTQDVIVDIYLTTTPYPEDEDANVERIDANRIRVTFPSPPAPGSRRVVVHG